MPNYLETTVSGTQWRRAKNVSIANPYEGVATIRFDEEDIIKLDTKSIPTNVPTDVKPLSLAFDPTAVVALLDPLTGQPTGSTITHMDLYIALNSLYMQLATERDTPPVVVTPNP